MCCREKADVYAKDNSRSVICSGVVKDLNEKTKQVWEVAVRRRPFSVILLDEIEKANSQISNVLLQTRRANHRVAYS